jgi:hypothetical protein
VDVLSGAFMLLRKSVLNTIGFLDEAFFMYGEDIDLSYRITQAGYKNYYFPETTIIHYKGESTKKKSANYVKVFYNAMVLFARKHYSQNMAGWFAFFIEIAVRFRAFLALIWRFVGEIVTPIADLLAVYFGFFAIARYWEVYNKFVRGFYPSEYYAVHIPAYIFIIIISVFLSGGYDRPIALRRVIRGALVGAVLVFAIYGFLPKDMQFSRAILLLGCAWALLALPLVRILFQFARTGKLRTAAAEDRRIIIVAAEGEAARIQSLLVQSGVQYGFLGMLHPSENKPTGWLGTLNQLSEVVAIFDINQVIFSAMDVPSAQIMSSMGELSHEQVNFKIVPENSLSIIGSSDKNTPGELYTIDVGFALSNRHVQRKKRILDMGICLMIWAIFPVALLRTKLRTMLAQSLWVFMGQKTWISYAGRDAVQGLPEMKSGVFYPAMTFANAALEANVNLAYARDYSVNKDIQLLSRIVFS